jgi:rare lipoprotein A
VLSENLLYFWCYIINFRHKFNNFIQIGIFSIQGNALKTADLLRADGIIPTVLEQSSQGRTFWRIIVGPAMTSDERSALLAKVKELGFADAYYVTN